MGASANKVWVVVANASTARLFRGTDDGSNVVEFETLAHPASRVAGRDLMTDGPGIAFRSTGAGWHTAGPETEIKQHELRSFATVIARRLDDARTHGDCRSVAVIAAPALLGELRARMNGPTGAMVGYTLDKNMVHAGARDLLAALPVRFLARA